MPSAALAVELAEASGEFPGGPCQAPPPACVVGGGAAHRVCWHLAFSLAPGSGAEFLESGQRRWVNFCPCHAVKLVSHRPHLLGGQDQRASAPLASWKHRRQGTLAPRPPGGGVLWTPGLRTSLRAPAAGIAPCGHVPVADVSCRVGSPLRRAPETCVSKPGFF